MSSDDSFADFMARLGCNDPAAANEIVRRYAEHLVNLAAPRLVGAIRRKVDPEDLVQSAFRSFFRSNYLQAFTFDSWENLWALLATLTLRKCRFQVRQFLTLKRHVNREESLDTVNGFSAGLEAASPEPTPLEAAAFADLVEQLLDSLEGKTRLIAELVLQGFSIAEIAPQVGLTERSVHRQMSRIRGRLRELDNVSDPNAL